MQNVLNVQNLTKVYKPTEKKGKPFCAVNKISFSLQDGEILGLLGPNGAGKSTTIAMLLGVLTPTSGEISYFDKDFAQSRSEILQSVTFASTYISFPWRLSVWENLKVYGRLFGVTGATFNDRTTRFLKFFGVLNQKNKTMNQLSAGQITRIMLAKAFIPHPKIVLLDEPTASLDPDIAHQVRLFIRKQQEEFRTSIIYTSHNMEEVTDLCARVVFLKQGNIIATDTPENLAKTITTCKMHLVIKDGLKRTINFSKEQGLEIESDNREVAITLEETQIAEFLSKLAKSGIQYTQISIDKPTLEDYFLAKSI
ncbi:hypothetical protein COW99_03425 [Candidatus Roizmanbacteria bacterium CG22_combo_CG10-13_8_21_14_all_38_20]|uniref:ABC transporter domain-containing protein n=1 Tax=Candidatus Roizmanbacteria bacterium CG22_combo_CG10-13_8_21_14_all_38_20 TaxID=1974862 RepID=A0A2H0BV91_9BACT|nr:ABC transporter ATP-binding protein [Candidatus Microgenomates bacterium]PIP61551.1 MAG: hypothetical protein COW99_03425 [Candidatus Roizmanbacteria bacterium CG22_combo_CG10-13_8_21_14_all_38_20]PJC31505.1 MAG: hypothetical protein CO050_02890 [Candidatus Roizmanbacteria bacterium CG_4_9_14_0_2_um_filter_38_17]